MRAVVTGASGLLGSDVADIFETEGYEVMRLMGRKDVNVCDAPAVEEYISGIMPDVVIHSAGCRDLDGMERHPYESFEVNTLGTRNIALACRMIRAKLVYISSDAVFDGLKNEPYHEFDDPRPVNIYGKTKLASERLIQGLWDKSFIVRSALLFGYKGHRENNLIYHVLDSLRAGKKISASIDQICCPSYTADLAIALCRLVQTEWYGIYHITNSGVGSRYEVACEVAGIAGLDAEMIEGISSAGKAARRAENTSFRSLAWTKTFGYELPDWHGALRRCMEEGNMLVMGADEQ